MLCRKNLSRSLHVSQASKAFSCTLSSKHQHLPYKTPFCSFKTTHDFCSLNSGIAAMTLVHVHPLSDFLLLPQTLHVHSADSALCCAVLLLSLCNLILSSRLLPPPQAVNPFPHFPSASNDLIPPPSTPHFLPSVFFILPFHLSSLFKNSPLPPFSP